MDKSNTKTHYCLPLNEDLTSIQFSESYLVRKKETVFNISQGSSSLQKHLTIVTQGKVVKFGL